MKCKPQRTLERQRMQKREEEKKLEQEYLNSLSDEERSKYLKLQENKRKEIWKSCMAFPGILQALDIPKKY